MINLPKPSQIRINGTPDEKIAYLSSYLLMLVNSIEQLIGGTKNKKTEQDVAVKDLKFEGNELIVVYTNGSEKIIQLLKGESL